MKGYSLSQGLIRHDALNTNMSLLLFIGLVPDRLANY